MTNYSLFSKRDIFSIVVIVVSFVLSFYFYQHFPTLVPTHWNIQGQANGFSSRAFAAFFFPWLILGIYLLLSVIPRIDPRRDRYQEFAGAYSLIKNCIIGFLFAIYFIASLAGIGYNIHMSQIIPALIGLLFISLGFNITRIKSNWFIGIRTPWTLSSDVVWDKTQRLGGKIFMAAGIVIILGSLLSTQVAFVTLIAAAVIAGFVPTIYSYIEYRKLQ
jgi:uncharacterized membrane protein